MDALIIEPPDADIMIMMQSMAKEAGVFKVFIGAGLNTYGAENYVTMSV